MAGPRSWQQGCHSPGQREGLREKKLIWLSDAVEPDAERSGDGRCCDGELAEFHC